MKNKIFILVTSFCYTFLLYQQGIGINLLILNIVIISCLFLSDPIYLKNKFALLFAIGAITSSLFAFINGHVITVLANILSLAFLSISIDKKQQSILTNIIHISFNYITAIAEIVKRSKNKYFSNNPENGQVRKQLIIYLSSITVFVLFILLYESSNITFHYFIQQFSVKILSFNLICFYAFSFVLMYAFFRPRSLAILYYYERTLPLYTDLKEYSSYKILGNEVEEETEFKTGVMMLGLLNLLLLIVNILDIQFILGSSPLPVNISYAEFVHQGIFSLILSIVIAICIILWYFRGNQNFAKNHTLKLLAYVWIAQNIIMLISAAYKNSLYIDEYALTYKRIGVYIFLLSTLLGLVFTFIKILQKRSNYYLIKANSLGWYFILLLSVPFAWDKIIAEKNIEQAISKNRLPDMTYLYNLSYQAYPCLVAFQMDYHLIKKQNYYTLDSVNSSHLMIEKLILFNENNKEYGWQSYNLARCKAYDDITKSLGEKSNLLQIPAIGVIKTYSENRNLFN